MPQLLYFSIDYSLRKPPVERDVVDFAYTQGDAVDFAVTQADVVDFPVTQADAVDF